MSADSNATANLAALGGQMAQAWQKLLESWWNTLLSDPGRLAELARGLSATDLGHTGPTTSDLAMVVQAVEMIEQRLESVEQKLQDLTDNLATVVGYLESTHPAGSERSDQQAG